MSPGDLHRSTEFWNLVLKFKICRTVNLGVVSHLYQDFAYRTGHFSDLIRVSSLCYLHLKTKSGEVSYCIERTWYSRVYQSECLWVLLLHGKWYARSVPFPCPPANICRHRWSITARTWKGAECDSAAYWTVWSNWNWMRVTSSCKIARCVYPLITRSSPMWNDTP